VSTILKALEKLERERSTHRVAGPVPIISASSHGFGGPAGWYLKPWFWLGLVGLVIVVVGGTAWHFYRQSRTDTPRLAQRSDAKAHQPARHNGDAHYQAATPPIPDAAKPKPRQPDPTPVGRPDPMHPQATGDHGRPQHPGEPSVSKALVTPPVQEKPSVPQPVPAASPARPPDQANLHRTPDNIAATKVASGKEDAAPANSPVLPDAAPKRNAPADVYANTPLLTDGRLRVHAIAWAPLPAERMAVINSRVLHEGDSVEDFAVMVIRPDDVVVREKGKGVWRVEFGRP
jgi:hypothetical protein